MSAGQTQKTLLCWGWNAWKEDPEVAAEMTTLLHLPDLVVSKLLTFLDPPTLLSLRLVSTTTKAWVDASFPLVATLGSASDLSSLLSFPSHSSSLSRFHFRLPHPFPLSPSRGILSHTFLPKFSPFLTHFEVTFCPGPDPSEATRRDHFLEKFLIQVLLSSRNLRVVKLPELSMTHLGEAGLPLLQENWTSNLQTLRISQLLCLNFYGISFFARLLSSLQVLEELEAPTIAISDPECLSFNHKLFFREYVVRPIISFLQDKGKGTLKRLYIQEYLFPEDDPSLLFELGEKCKGNGTLLFPQTFLPFSRSLFLGLPPSTTKEVVPFLGRLCGLNDAILSLSGLSSLEFLSMSFRSFLVSDSVLEAVEEFSHLELRQLKEVEVEMCTDPPWEGRPSKLSRFLHKFCRVPLPSVKVLRLDHASRANDTTLLETRDISRGFPNLRELDVSGWDGGAKDHKVLWEGMGRLEKLRFCRCPHFGDEAVQGGMEGLKSLKVLILEEVGDDCLTNAAFPVFASLPLRKFVHRVRDAEHSRITSRGYFYLHDGLTRKTMEEPNVSISLFQQYFDYVDFLGGFPNLKMSSSFTPFPPSSSSLLRRGRGGQGGHHGASCDIL